MHFRNLLLTSAIILLAQLSYGQQKEMLQQLYYEKTPTGWAFQTREDYTYNEAHQLTSMISMDSTENGWINRLQEDIHYSTIPNSHQRIEVIREGMDSTWGDPKHTIFLQDKNGHDAMEITMDYDSTESIGLLFRAGFYTLNEEGKPVTKRYAQPQDQGWLNQDLTTLTYANGNLESEVNSIWVTDTWRQRTKTTYTYSPDQAIEHVELFNLDKVTGEISTEPATLILYQYDSEKHLIEYRIQKKRSGVWTDVFKRVSIWGIPKSRH